MDESLMIIMSMGMIIEAEIIIVMKDQMAGSCNNFTKLNDVIRDTSRGRERLLFIIL